MWRKFEELGDSLRRTSSIPSLHSGISRHSSAEETSGRSRGNRRTQNSTRQQPPLVPNASGPGRSGQMLDSPGYLQTHNVFAGRWEYVGQCQAHHDQPRSHTRQGAHHYVWRGGASCRHQSPERVVRVRSAGGGIRHANGHLDTSGRRRYRWPEHRQPWLSCDLPNRAPALVASSSRIPYATSTTVKASRERNTRFLFSMLMVSAQPSVQATTTRTHASIHLTARPREESGRE